MEKSKSISNKKKILYSFITIFFSLSIFLIISEILLRLIPIPGIEYNVSTYDTLTGGGYYPNSINYYRNDRGDFVKRKANKWGYFDRNYSKEKNANTIRIGFFGDSFTQVIQVPLEETYHYIIGDSLNNLNIETLSFGVSGFSTYQSYLTCNKWDDFFDLDMVVYVFCENDLGDQVESVKQTPNVPYPILSGDSIIADNSFKELRKNRTKLYFKLYNYLTANFLVFTTITHRLKLLMEYGIKMDVDENDRFMTNGKNDPNTILYPPDLTVQASPGQWPDSLKNIAISLEKIILLKWKNELEKKHKLFAILYTPRNITIPINDQNSWKPWLENFCLENEIPFIDPTDNLKITQNLGNDVFYDHYTKYGHKAVSDTFISWYLMNFNTSK